MTAATTLFEVHHERVLRSFMRRVRTSKILAAILQPWKGGGHLTDVPCQCRRLRRPARGWGVSCGPLKAYR